MYSGFVTEVSRHPAPSSLKRGRRAAFAPERFLSDWRPASDRPRHPRVGASETPLVLDAKELKEADPATRNLLQEISARRELGLVNYARRGTKHVYTFQSGTC